MPEFHGITVPTDGQRITFSDDGRPQIPSNPIIPFIRGDGTGPDIWNASQPVFDAAVRRAYGDARAIRWMEVFAGEEGERRFGQYLPDSTLEALSYFAVGIKGPLTTPVGGGIRSLNVTLRQKFDLYACIRPVRYFSGVPSPVKEPEKLDVVIFRENTEDVYAGIEWAAGTPEAERLIAILRDDFGKTIRPDSGIGIKPISRTGTQRLVRRAIQYAIDHQLPSVTLVHKGNIQKFTEGAFRDWGYELARTEFAAQTITEDEVYAQHDGKAPAGRIIIKDRIADAMFQQILLRPAEYSVLAMPNLNGDYFSDAAAAQVGGLGMAPGSVILSGVMLLEYLGWNEAAQLIVQGLERTIAQKRVTYDLERQMEGATKLSTSAFGQAIVENMSVSG